MSIDAVDVVESYEDALGQIAYDAREVAGIIRRALYGVPKTAEKLAGAVEALAAAAEDAYTGGPGSTVYAWRHAGCDGWNDETETCDDHPEGGPA